MRVFSNVRLTKFLLPSLLSPRLKATLTEDQFRLMHPYLFTSLHLNLSQTHGLILILPTVLLLCPFTPLSLCFPTFTGHRLLDGTMAPANMAFSNSACPLTAMLFFERTALDECVSIDIAANTRLRPWEAIGRKPKKKRKTTKTCPVGLGRQHG